MFIAGDPAARARSHYLHQVRKAREHRPFAEAVAEPTSVHMEQSCYRSCLDPYLSGPAATRLLVVRFEDLTGPDPDAWYQVLAHLGLKPRTRPDGAVNTGDAGVQYTSAMRALYDRGLIRLGRAPAPLRRLGRRLPVRSSPTDPALVASVEAPVPDGVAERWHADAVDLAEALGWVGDPWDPT